MVTVTGPQYIIYMWITTAICLLFVLVRLQIRRRIKGGLRLSDYLVIAAWFAFLYQDVTDTYTLTQGLYLGKIDPYAKEFGEEHGLASYDDTVVVLKLLYVELAFYYTEMYFVKGAMLAFYYELFPKSMPKLRWALHAVSGFTFISWLSSILVKLFLCMPIERNYIPGPNFCDPTSNFRSNLYEWILHVATDLCIYILPMFLLRTLSLPWKQKMAVAATFAVGLVCIVWANLFQVSVLQNDPTAVSWFYGATEQWWALVVVCCPTFRALVNKKDVRSAWRYIRGDESSGGNSYDMSHGPNSTFNNTRNGGGTQTATMASMRRSVHKVHGVSCAVEGGVDDNGWTVVDGIKKTIETTREVQRVDSSDESLHKAEMEMPTVETKVESAATPERDGGRPESRAEINRGPPSVNSKRDVKPFDFLE